MFQGHFKEYLELLIEVVKSTLCNGATAINLTFFIFSILNLIFMRLDQFDHADFKSENRF
jgi:hypothetical protein